MIKKWVVWCFTHHPYISTVVCAILLVDYLYTLITLPNVARKMWKLGFREYIRLEKERVFEAFNRKEWKK